MRTLNRMDLLDPLLLKNREHLNAEDKAKIEAYKRRLERRVDSIASRCNFFEIYRNKNLFGTEAFYSLLSKSVAKTAKTELPAELKDYAD